MIQMLWSFLKARWHWGQGRCPACLRPLGPALSRDSDCGVCNGETDPLSVWRNYRHLGEKQPAIHLAEQALTRAHHSGWRNVEVEGAFRSGITSGR